MKIQRFGAAFAAVSIGFAATAYAQTSAGSGGADQTSLSDVQTGQKLFQADGCWECHGTVGQGGGLAGPRLAPMALPYDAFIYELRTPRNTMPPFEANVLPDIDAANIYAFLKSIPPALPAADIPLLNN
jgi:mono/diheme cytochrome c family protein